MFTTILLHMYQIFSSLRGHLHFSVQFSLHLHGNFFLDDPLLKNDYIQLLVIFKMKRSLRLRLCWAFVFVRCCANVFATRSGEGKELKMQTKNKRQNMVRKYVKVKIPYVKVKVPNRGPYRNKYRGTNERTYGPTDGHYLLFRCVFSSKKSKQ